MTKIEISLEADQPRVSFPPNWKDQDVETRAKMLVQLSILFLYEAAKCGGECGEGGIEYILVNSIEKMVERVCEHGNVSMNDIDVMSFNSCAVGNPWSKPN